MIPFFNQNGCKCLHFSENPAANLWLSYCGIEHCSPNHFFDASERSGWHLHVIVSGSGELIVEDKVFHLHYDQLFLTKPWEKCVYHPDPQNPWSYCWMTFDGPDAKRLMEHAGFTDGVNYLDCHLDTNLFYKLVDGILKEPEMSIANDLSANARLLEYISLAIRSHYASRKRIRNPSEYTSEDYVKRAKTMIEGNYQSIRISDLARNIGLNRSYLSELFKQSTGISPQEYLAQCRMDHSREYLIYTDCKIQEIASMVGYNDALAFSKYFKKKFWMSPTEYRCAFRDVSLQEG